MSHVRRLGALSLLLLGLSGCTLIGALASKAPLPDVDAAYKGLAGKKVGIMIWADKSVLLDWPNLQLDAGNSIIYKLLIAQQAESKELIGTTFPYPPGSFVKYQREHPELDAIPVTEYAGKLGVDRLIYVEINDLSTRADGGSNLFLGRIDASLKIIEIDDKKAGKLGYSEQYIKAQYPEKAQKEGVLNGNDRIMYAGAVNTATNEIVKRLIKHPAEE
jgi:hypothetical protein